MRTDTTLRSALTYAGALPFVACAVLQAAGSPAVAGVSDWALVAAGYGVAIAAFMAGVHWGTWLYHSAAAPLNLLLSSNAITVAVWLGFVFAPVRISLGITTAAFVLLLLIDYRLAACHLLNADYMRMRRNVTAIVVACLLLTIIFI